METLRKRLNIDYFKREILKTTYGTRPSIVARLDPRTLFGWYLVFAIAPWFFYNNTILIGMAALVALVAALTRVSGMIIFFLAFGMASQVVSLMVTVLMFGGQLDAFWSISTLILKLLIVSLASIAAFAGLDPERLSDGLLALGLPTQLAFGVSYGFRIIPVLIDEYQNVFNACRLRSRAPSNRGVLGVRVLVHWFRLILRSFYPMMLNTAKRTRTTIEGLEIRGFTYSVGNPEVKRVKLAYLRFTRLDALWTVAMTGGLAAVLALGYTFPL